MADNTTPPTQSDTSAKDATGAPAVGEKAGKAAIARAESTIKSGTNEMDRQLTQDASSAAADAIALASHKPAISTEHSDEENINVEAMAGPTVDDSVAKSEQQKHPGAPLYDPNVIPVHENRISIGQRIQNLQRKDYVDLFEETEAEVATV